MSTTETPPAIQQVEMTEAEIAIAETMARRLGYTQTAYTSTSEIWGLYRLPDNARQKSGVIFKTAQFGLVFFQDMEDLHMDDLRKHNQKLAGVI